MDLPRSLLEGLESRLAGCMHRGGARGKWSSHLGSCLAGEGAGDGVHRGCQGARQNTARVRLSMETKCSTESIPSVGLRVGHWRPRASVDGEAAADTADLVEESPTFGVDIGLGTRRLDDLTG